jgi:hypothetical protein
MLQKSFSPLSRQILSWALVPGSYPVPKRHFLTIACRIFARRRCTFQNMGSISKTKLRKNVEGMFLLITQHIKQLTDPDILVEVVDNWLLADRHAGLYA